MVEGRARGLSRRSGNRASPLRRAPRGAGGCAALRARGGCGVVPARLGSGGGAARHLGNLATAILAVIAVLPEYAVDLYFGWSAGHIPENARYAAANMTGSNRL